MIQHLPQERRKLRERLRALNEEVAALQAPAVVMLDMTHPLLENEGMSALLAELACTLLLVR